MDWTSRTSFQWDWETLALCNVEETEMSNPPEEPKSVSESSIGMVTGSIYSRGVVKCSSSGAGDCPFQSSIPASVASSSKSTMTAPDINFKFEEFLNNQNRKRGLALVDSSETSEEVLSAEDVKEALIGLKLGRRMYFEDPCVGNNTKDSSSSASITSLTTSLKKPRVYQQNMLSTYCQVEGCKVDLTIAKDYHRKHRVCERHSKFPKVVVAGQERRFCQQCSSLIRKSVVVEDAYLITMRKPQQETIAFSSSKLTPSGDKEHPNVVFSQAPFSLTTTRESSIWDGSDSFKLTQIDGSWIKSCKIGGINTQAIFPSSYCRVEDGPTDGHDLGKPRRSVAAEFPNQGLGASVALNSDGARHLQRAFSLLSVDSHLPPNTGTTSSEQFVYGNNNNGANPAMHLLNAKRSVWQAEQPVSATPPFNSKGNGALLQEYLLFKTSYGTGFFDSNHLG